MAKACYSCAFSVEAVALRAEKEAVLEKLDKILSWQQMILSFQFTYRLVLY